MHRQLLHNHSSLPVGSYYQAIAFEAMGGSAQRKSYLGSPRAHVVNVPECLLAVLMVFST
jgi:hypothetical protein